MTSTQDRAKNNRAKAETEKYTCFVCEKPLDMRFFNPADKIKFCGLRCKFYFLEKNKWNPFPAKAKVKT